MTNYQTLSNHALIEHLDHIGRTPPPELLRTLLARRIDLRSTLLDRFAESIDDDWDDADDPRWYRAVHYGFLLIALRERKALPIFAAIYTDSETYESLIEWFQDAPAHYGAAAIPVFQQVVNLALGDEWDFGAAVSIAILKAIARRFPETRLQIVEFLRSCLPPLPHNGSYAPDEDQEHDNLWGSLIDALAGLRDNESTSQILALFDADMIDPIEIDKETYLNILQEPPSTVRDERFDILERYARVTRRDDASSA